MSKYKAKKCIIDGITFDSKKEGKRYAELRELEKRGEIADLKTQVKFELIPSQRYGGKVIERAVTYIADFTYYYKGDYVVEDVKSSKRMIRPEYIIKRKLMLYLKGIRVREVY